MTATTTRTHGEQNAAAHLETIVGAYRAIEWLRSPVRDDADWDIEDGALDDEARRILKEEDYEEGMSDRECDDMAEAIEESLRGDALSAEVRAGWTALGTTLEPEEWRVLLSTGGPALHVIGQLDHNGEPTRPRLQWQDWGTPWTDYRVLPEEREALQWFAGLFFWGDC